MIELKQLRFFVAVAEELHFARAADRLGVAQSVLSTQIQKLEQDLGTVLLRRNKRQPVSLTDAGTLFMTEALSALRHIERADQVGRLAARGLAGVIRIGFVTSAVNSGLLPTLLKAFRESHQNVRIEMVPMESPRQTEALNNGQIDIGILRPRRHYPDGVGSIDVLSESLYLAMAETHPLSTRPNIVAADLKNERFIAPHFQVEEDEGFSHVLSALGKVGGFAPNLDSDVQDFMSAAALASAGYGVVIVPASMKNVAVKGLCYKPISDFDVQVRLVVAHRRREVSPATRALIQQIERDGS